MANIYLNNKTFLGDTTDLDKTWAFFSDLAAKFPLTKGDARVNVVVRLVLTTHRNTKILISTIRFISKAK